MLSAGEEVCGRTTGPKRHKETLWWIERFSVMVSDKKYLFKKWFKTSIEEV